MNNKFLDAMNYRHACKEFDANKMISETDLNTILEIGRLSPSSFGFEPWEFLIIQNSDLREKLKSFSWGAQGQLPTASHFLIILARKKSGMIYSSPHIKHMMTDIQQLPEDVIKMKGDIYEEFQKVGFNLLDSERTIFDWACKQSYIALGNMMTGAAYLGIDSCPIEGFDAKKMETFIKKDLKVDTNNYGVACMVAFGYRKVDPRPKTRQELKSVSKWYK
jgi:nitroreductase